MSALSYTLLNRSLQSLVERLLLTRLGLLDVWLFKVDRSAILAGVLDREGSELTYLWVNEFSILLFDLIFS